MKKNLLFFLAFFLLQVSSRATNHAFHRGNLTFELGTGIQFYGSRIHTEFGTTRKDTNDYATGVHFPFKVEFGISDRIGLGFRLNSASYLQSVDSISHKKPTVKGIDAGLVLNFHLVRIGHFDLPLSVTYGYSKFSIFSNDPLKTKAISSGSNLGFSLTPRIYFIDNLGLFFNIGYMSCNYPDFRYSNSVDPDLNKTWNAHVAVKLSGFNMGIGLIGKF